MEPWFGSEEKDEINRYLDEGGWITEFKRTARFEEELAAYTGADTLAVDPKKATT